MGGRGGSEGAGGWEGNSFSVIVTETAKDSGFKLNELQKLILEIAEEREIITKERGTDIVDDGEMDIPGLQDVLDEAENKKFHDPQGRPKKIRARSVLLRDALNFWKLHHGGKLPELVQEFFDAPYNKDTYLRGSQNFSNELWVEMTSQLDKFGQWLNLVLADELVGLPMPTNFSDYE